DAIYNGAMDDASGVASMIEIARLLKTSGVKTKRSVMFVAVTAEEKGLLGSRYFAGRPTVPFKQIVANINLDMFLPLYPLKVIEVQGFAESSLGDSVRAAAKTLGIDVQTDREPEQNRFIRSDQYSFIRKGVPALAFKFGYEFGSPEETIRRNWVRDVYHQPGDDTKQSVNLEAAATFNRVIMTLLQQVANDAARPTWKADSFKDLGCLFDDSKTHESFNAFLSRQKDTRGPHLSREPSAPRSLSASDPSDADPSASARAA
ncbi:MAG TPA: M20/M25/M40 family metallo-hydrolase, partial [Vicinamibacterales bacterium]